MLFYPIAFFALNNLKNILIEMFGHVAFNAKYYILSQIFYFKNRVLSSMADICLLTHNLVFSKLGSICHYISTYHQTWRRHEKERKFGTFKRYLHQEETKECYNFEWTICNIYCWNCNVWFFHLRNSIY